MSDESADRRPRFRRHVPPPPVPADPESLFGELPHGPRRVPALWSHQADLLRSYTENKNIDAPDIALELPTGSGKTLVGLLIADWRRRHHNHRVVYACPTKQLARQVVDAAGRENIPATLLIGKRRTWNPAEYARYSSGQAVAVTVYSHVFNTNPAFEDAQAVLFDDAHAAEGYVAEAWALEITQDHAAYAALLDQVRASLDPQLVSWMTDPNADAATRHDVRLLPMATVMTHIEQIDRILSTACRDDGTRYRFAMIRPGLSSCLFYLSPASWYIRPLIPPTVAHPAFTDPNQRIYLSATLGDAGELERAFGRTQIERIPVPPAWERTGAGRRFFVFPDLASGKPSGNGSMLRSLVDLANRRIVLTPDDANANRIADELEVPPEERFTAKDPSTGLQPFLSAPRGTLLAANRYDGMDLPGDACRMMVMSGVPDAMHPQDRFLATKLRATNVLNERVRTRVIQGAGRCTRGPRDYAVVVIEGSDLLRFLSRADVRAALPIELQAEIDFGLENSKASARDLVQLTESAYLQDDVWQEDAEPDLAERRRGLTRTLPPESMNLASSAPREVEAWQAAWHGDWEAAARAAVAVLEHLTEPGLRPYRALWAYLGSSWSTLAARDGVPAAAERAAALLRTAHKAAIGSTWLREIQPPETAETEQDPLDEGAAAGVLEALGGVLKSASTLDLRCAEMMAALSQTDPERYEQGLIFLGTLLGAEAFKPPGKGRTDSAWLWPNLWVTIEAKSDQKPEGMLSMDLVRQANTQLDSLAADRGTAAPVGSLSLIASPRKLVDPDAVPIASPHLHLVVPDVLLALAGDAVRAWKQVRGAVAGVTGEAGQDTVARVLWEYQLLPTQVRDRLTRSRIRGA